MLCVDFSVMCGIQFVLCAVFSLCYVQSLVLLWAVFSLCYVLASLDREGPNKGPREGLKAMPNIKLCVQALPS